MRVAVATSSDNTLSNLLKRSSMASVSRGMKISTWVLASFCLTRRTKAAP